MFNLLFLSGRAASNCSNNIQFRRTIFNFFFSIGSPVDQQDVLLSNTRFKWTKRSLSSWTSYKQGYALFSQRDMLTGRSISNGTFFKSTARPITHRTSF